MTTSTFFKVSVTDIANELSTRPVGAIARTKILSLLERFDGVEVDFLQRSLTPSFADECIGRLAAEIGVAEFKRRIKIVNLQDATKPLVKHVIMTRLHLIAA